MKTVKNRYNAIAICFLVMLFSCSQNDPTFQAEKPDFAVLVSKNLLWSTSTIESKKRVLEKYPKRFIYEREEVDSLIHHLKGFEYLDKAGRDFHQWSHYGMLYFYKDYHCFDSLEIFRSFWLHEKKLYSNKGLRNYLTDLQEKGRNNNYRKPN